MMITEHIKNIDNSAAKLLSHGVRPKIGLILGSGLGDFADNIDNKTVIPYTELDGFPIPKVEGHAGEAILGQINGVDIICFNGRQHLYETNEFYPLKTMIRTLKKIGVETLFVTNAAGSLNYDIPRGDIMVITDHINYMGINPLIGDNDNEFGPRFPDMNNAWDQDLRAKLLQSAKDTKVDLKQGVYVAFRGPNFETPAEIKMARNFGGDAVGMSSVPECLIARHCGLKVIGCSAITNLGAGMVKDEILSHDHTFEGANMASDKLKTVLVNFISNY